MSLLPLKICGLTRTRDAALCAEVGAAYAGFVFAAKSPRCVSPGRAARMDTGRAARVGVFAGAGPEEVRETMRLARLDYAQLHGGEDAAFCRAVGPERVIKVFWPEALRSGEESEGALPAALERECARFASVCALFLLDAGLSGGGSGQSLPFRALRAFRPARPWLLAGGLGPRNLAEAVAACAPLAFDCNSGLEEEPGRKNPALVRRAASILARHRA